MIATKPKTSPKSNGRFPAAVQVDNALPNRRGGALHYWLLQYVTWLELHRADRLIAGHCPLPQKPKHIDAAA